jgi:hypothetical protein
MGLYMPAPTSRELKIPLKHVHFSSVNKSLRPRAILDPPAGSMFLPSTYPPLTSKVSLLPPPIQGVTPSFTSTTYPIEGGLELPGYDPSFTSITYPIEAGLELLDDLLKVVELLYPRNRQLHGQVIGWR